MVSKSRTEGWSRPYFFRKEKNMNSIIHDCLAGFFLMAGLFFGYFIAIYLLNWFYKNYKIIKRNNEKEKEKL